MSASPDPKRQRKVPKKVSPAKVTSKKLKGSIDLKHAQTMSFLFYHPTEVFGGEYKVVTWASVLRNEGEFSGQMVCRLCMLADADGTVDTGEMEAMLEGRIVSRKETYRNNACTVRKHLASRHYLVFEGLGDSILYGLHYGLRNSTGAATNEREITFTGLKTSQAEGCNKSPLIRVSSDGVASGCGTAEVVSREEMLDLLGQLMCEENIPLSLIDKEAFRTLLSRFAPDLWASFNPPINRRVVSSHIPNVAQKTRQQIREELKKVTMLSISTDEWAKNKKGVPLITLTVYFAVSGVLQVRILDVIPVRKNSTSDELASLLVTSLREADVLHKVVSITTDGARAEMGISTVDPSGLAEAVAEATASGQGAHVDMDEIIAKLDERICAFHTRCQAHLFNLVLKSTCVSETKLKKEEERKVKDATGAGSSVVEKGDSVVIKNKAAGSVIAGKVKKVKLVGVRINMSRARAELFAELQREAQKKAAAAKAKAAAKAAAKDKEEAEEDDGSVEYCYDSSDDEEEQMETPGAARARASSSRSSSGAGPSSTATFTPSTMMDVESTVKGSKATAETGSQEEGQEVEREVAQERAQEVLLAKAKEALEQVEGDGGEVIDDEDEEGVAPPGLAALAVLLQDDLWNDEFGDVKTREDLQYLAYLPCMLQSRKSSGAAFPYWSASRWASVIDLLLFYLQRVSHVRALRAKLPAGDPFHAVPEVTDADIDVLQRYVLLVAPMHVLMTLLQRRTPAASQYVSLLHSLLSFYTNKPGIDGKVTTFYSLMEKSGVFSHLPECGRYLARVREAILSSTYAMESPSRIELKEWPARRWAYLTGAPGSGSESGPVGTAIRLCDGLGDDYAKELVGALGTEAKMLELGLSKDERKKKTAAIAREKKEAKPVNGVVDPNAKRRLGSVDRALTRDLIKKRRAALVAVKDTLIAGVKERTLKPIKEGLKGFQILSLPRMFSKPGAHNGWEAGQTTEDTIKLIGDFQERMGEFVTEITDRRLSVLKAENARRDQEEQKARSKAEGGAQGGAGGQEVGKARHRKGSTSTTKKKRKRKSKREDVTRQQELLLAFKQAHMVTAPRSSSNTQSHEVAGARVDEEVRMREIGRDHRKRDAYRATEREWRAKEKAAKQALGMFARSAEAFFRLHNGQTVGHLRGNDDKVTYMEEAVLYTKYLCCWERIGVLSVLAADEGKREGRSPINIVLFLWSWLADHGPSSADPKPLPGGDDLAELEPLAVYAVALLQCPLSSAEDERVFSSAGNIFAPLRQRLGPDIGAAMLVVRLYARLVRSGRKDASFVEKMQTFNVFWNERGELLHQ